jgi:hypothetical protein
MPRIKRGLAELPRAAFPDLLQELIAELRTNRQGGQPRIDEQTLPRTGKIRVTVLWDKWDGIADEDRLTTIFAAYKEVEGEAFCEQIVLAMGLTFPEAVESGLLPFQIVPLLRKDDAVKPEQCHAALLDEGASTLIRHDHPELRFATLEEAEACVKRLVAALPGSADVWAITREVGHIEQY